MSQADTALQLTCSCADHSGPRTLPRGWFPKAGNQRRSSWCRVCLRLPRALHAARRRGAGVRPVSGAELKKLWRAQQGICARCGISLLAGYEIDHVWPVARGGRHEFENLQLLCVRCNRGKGARVNWRSP